jgi:hypothetical protein
LASRLWSSWMEKCYPWRILENDPTMSLEDARFSVLRYFAAEIQNAYGPNVHVKKWRNFRKSHRLVPQSWVYLVLDSNCSCRSCSSY